MRESVARRVLSGLLALYPSSFRLLLGEDLVETALDRRRDAKRRAPKTGELRFWLTEGIRFGWDGVLERLSLMPGRLDDLRHGWRQVRRAPAHHGLAIVTLALGVAATTTIFTVTDAVVFRPLSYDDAERLYLVHAQLGPMELSGNSLPNLMDLRASVRSMSWLAAAQDRSPALVDALPQPERISVLDVTENYLTRLGGVVQRGRGFLASDHAAGAERVAIISDVLWQQRWNRDPAVIGRSIQLDGRAHTIVGVMRAAFRDPEPIESGAITGAWVPVREGDRTFAHRDDYGFRVLGRLADGQTIEAAQAELSAIGARLAAAYPEANRYGKDNLGFILRPLQETTVGEARNRILLLLGAVILLLLLSCANVANLYLARGVRRMPELAVRSALGATRARLGLQLFGESLVTAGLASMLGGILAIAGVRAFLGAAPEGIPRLHEINIDVRVLGFIVLLTLFTAVVFGSAPAVRGARSSGAAAAGGARLTDSFGAQRIQSLLVALEVALSLVLVTGALLLVNSFARMLRVEPGFDASDVIVADVRPPHAADTHMAELAFYRTLMEHAAEDPRVARSALMHATPGILGGTWNPVTIDEEMAEQATERSRASASGNRPDDRFMRMNPVYGDAFEALDMTIVAGRGLSNNPRAGEPHVVVLNQAAAALLFGEKNPIGRRIALGQPDSKANLREVVGVVADVKQQGAVKATDAQVYLPYEQRDVPRMQLVLELHPGATLGEDEIRRLVREAAPDVPVDRVDMFGARYAATGDLARFLTLLLTVFAAIGLLLAVVGTYATASHLLSRRTRELGIRLALGARAVTVFRVMLARALAIAGAGIIAGLSAALALSRFLEGYVFGVGARDPLTMAGAAILIGSVVALASLGPAVRAARVDPNRVLRE